MQDYKVLYKIKTLEKLIVRNIMNEEEICSMKTPTPTQVQIMEYILEHQNEEVYQKDLEDILNLRRATVSGVLQTMEKHGLLDRQIAKNDARVKKIILSKKAEQLFLEKKKQFEKIEKALVQDISEQELRTFSNVLNKMMMNAKKISENFNDIPFPLGWKANIIRY